MREGIVYKCIENLEGEQVEMAVTQRVLVPTTGDQRESGLTWTLQHAVGAACHRPLPHHGSAGAQKPPALQVLLDARSRQWAPAVVGCSRLYVAVAVSEASPYLRLFLRVLRY